MAVYPWASQKADATVCDVAGGNGHVTMGLLKAHPHLKLVLQDQPQVLDQAREVIYLRPNTKSTAD